MTARVFVQSVEIEQSLICLPKMGQRDGCQHHEHTPGPRRLNVNVVPVLSEADESDWVRLAGRTVELL